MGIEEQVHEIIWLEGEAAGLRKGKAARIREGKAAGLKEGKAGFVKYLLQYTSSSIEEIARQA